jgi:hypothetical protein
MRREAAFARAAGPAGVCPRAADRRRRARRSCENVCPRAAAGAPRQCAHFRVRGRPAAAPVDGNARPDDERPFGFVCKNGRRRWCAPAHERRCVACGARTRSPAVDGGLALSLAARSGFLGFRDALGARCRRSDAGALPHVADLALAGVSERGLRLAARLCPNLKSLDVSGCAGGGDAAVLAALLERCPKLETLVVGAVGAAGLRTLAALGLRSLSVGDFGYGDLGPLAAALDGAPPTLAALRVDCHHFCFAGWAAPPPASAARGLRSVERLRVASAWGDPGWLWGLAPNVAALSLAGCRSVGDAPGLRGLGRLADLDVSGSPYVTGFSRPAVRQLARTLARLDVSDCASMFCVDFAAGLSALEVLEARGLGIAALPRGLGELARLRRVDVSRCAALAELPASLGDGAPALRAVDVAGCPALAKFPASLVQRGVLRGWGS